MAVPQCPHSSVLLQAGRSLPDVAPLVWQGMLSFGGSAALDEMFGAHASAAKGYCKAAVLADLLQRQAARPWEAADEAAGARAVASAGAARPASGGPTAAHARTVDAGSSGAEHVPESRAGEMAGGEQGRAGPMGGRSGCAAGCGDGDCGSPGEETCEGEDTCDELLVDALQHQEERGRARGVIHGWECDLDVDQQKLLREYRGTIAKRHAACVRQ